MIDDLRRTKMRKYRAWSFIRGTSVLAAILMVNLVGWAILVSLVVFAYAIFGILMKYIFSHFAALVLIRYFCAML